MKRLNSIDFVRGFVMVIMALDHTRDFMHVTSITQNALDLNVTTPAVFFTRWITHLCAPTFVFLSGVSAYLSFKNKNDVAASRKFLWTRGLWLIFLEFTLVNFGIWFDVRFSVFIFEVIAVIGFGFIVLSFLLNVPAKTLGFIGLGIIFLHNLFPYIPFAENSVLKTILTPLFTQTAFPFTPKTLLIMGYPPIPWLGIMLTGFGAGKLFELNLDERKKYFLRIGISALFLFVIIRFINIYGNSTPWSTQKNGLYTFLSFINITKQPPSLIFCLSTLGIMFLIFYLSDGVENTFTKFVTVYGKVPLFYFLVHFYLLHTLMLIVMFTQGFTLSDLEFGTNLGRPKAASGLELSYIYLIWLSVVLVLYPVCKWYGNYKLMHTEKTWLRYF